MRGIARKMHASKPADKESHGHVAKGVQHLTSELRSKRSTAIDKVSKERLSQLEGFKDQLRSPFADGFPELASKPIKAKAARGLLTQIGDFVPAPGHQPNGSQGGNHSGGHPKPNDPPKVHDDLPPIDPGGGSAGGGGGGIYTLTNDPPAAVADGYEVPHDQVLEVEAAGVLANDADPESDPLTAVLVTGPEHGLLLAFNDDGSFSYEPDPLYVGSDSFTYRATDGFGDSNEVTVTINVTNANPVAQDDVFGVHPNQTVHVPAFGVLANDTDADDNYLTANLVAGPSCGTLTFQEDGSFSYTPPASFIGVQAFTYVASDGISTGNTATVQLNVHDANAAPTASNDSITTAHNVDYFSDLSELLANDADADFDPLTATVVSQPAHGTVTFHGDGTFHYQPNGVFAGDDSFTYKVNDGLADSSAVVVTITVTNEEPAAGDDNYVIGHDQTLAVPAPGILANDFDREGAAVTLSLLTAPAHGALTLNADGSFSFVPQAAWSGTDSFTYRLSDGTAQGDAATVWLYVTNTAPLGAPDFYGTPSGQPLSVTGSGLLANDSDLENDSITITV